MSETETDRAWVVSTALTVLHGEHFSYQGPPPEPGDVIQVQSSGETVLNVRVNRVDPSRHQIEGAETD